MITTPILRGSPVMRGTCGRTAVQNAIRAFWCSRSRLLIEPVDLPALARQLRRTWP